MRAPSPKVAEQQAHVPFSVPTENLPANIEPGVGHIVRVPAQAPVFPQTGFANIAAAISAIMSEIGVVGEGGENKFQNYKYMSYKDMYRKLTPLMGKHGLAVIPTEKICSIFDNDAVVTATYSFTIIHKSGEVWPFQPEWTGVSRARDSKGGWDDKSLNKCATAAQKYFLKALFQVPSGEDDEDPDHNDGSTVSRERIRAPSPGQSQTKAAANPLVAKGADANLWTSDLKRLIGDAKSLADLNMIDEANAEGSQRLSSKFPVLYREVYDCFVAAKKKFAKSDPISSGPLIAVKYSEDQTGFTNSIIDLMDSAKTWDILQRLYNDHLAPIEEDMFPADRDNCLSALRRNENRLAP